MTATSAPAHYARDYLQSILKSVAILQKSGDLSRHAEELGEIDEALADMAYNEDPS